MPPTDDKKNTPNTNTNTDRTTENARDLPSKDASGTHDKDEDVKGGRMKQRIE